MDRERVMGLVRDLIAEVGEDPSREGLRGTPARVADMFGELFAGYGADAELDVQFAESSEAVVVRDIRFYSMCEHHLLPFFGRVHIAYSPAGSVFGVSKLVRLVEKHARRMQIQERLTRAVADELYAQGVKGVAVVAEAEHLCMKMRGVRNDVEITSSAFRGSYQEASAREAIAATIQGRPQRRHAGAP